MNTFIKKLTIVASSVLVVALAGRLFFTTKQQNPNELIVGMMSGWAPFMSINAQGESEGFDVDVATQLAKRMGKKLVIKDLGSLATLLLALEQGKIDMIFSGLDITQNRLRQMAMVPYTGSAVTAYQLVFWQKVPTGITTINDLQKLGRPVICVEPGSSPEKFIDQFPFIDKKSLPSLAEMLMDVQYGKSLALFVEPQVAARLIKKNPALAQLTIPLPPAFQIYGMGIALKKNNQTLTNQVTTTIRAMRRDGTLKMLETRWQLYQGA